jgi:hypothetical protein
MGVDVLSASQIRDGADPVIELAAAAGADKSWFFAVRDMTTAREF